jgi:hypothetical protein
MCPVPRININNMREKSLVLLQQMYQESKEGIKVKRCCFTTFKFKRLLSWKLGSSFGNGSNHDTDGFVSFRYKLPAKLEKFFQICNKYSKTGFYIFVQIYTFLVGLQPHCAPVCSARPSFWIMNTQCCRPAEPEASGLKAGDQETCLLSTSERRLE